ncbi:hypothetical protein ACHAWT_004829 [Skeletonema menzelii]
MIAAKKNVSKVEARLDRIDIICKNHRKVHVCSLTPSKRYFYIVDSLLLSAHCQNKIEYS